MKRGSIHQDIAIINKDAPNIRASKYIKQISIESKKEIKRYTVIVGYFTPFTSIESEPPLSIKERKPDRRLIWK